MALNGSKRQQAKLSILFSIYTKNCRPRQKWIFPLQMSARLSIIKVYGCILFRALWHAAHAQSEPDAGWAREGRRFGRKDALVHLSDTAD
jgi:hypothetical protein